jgi:hypothetical protein
MSKLHLTVKVGDTLEIEGVGQIAVEHKTGQRTRLVLDIADNRKVNIIEKQRPAVKEWRS